MFGVPILIGKNSDSGGAEFVRCSERANGNLSTICHKNFREHLCLSLLYRSLVGDSRRAVEELLYSVTQATRIRGSHFHSTATPGVVVTAQPSRIR
ncbi:hypothetical protein BLSMQ_1992 [Brevibacterium aurantiacum]|uniref:Uncharacterized protein n=1 Tax=Brevibacterium aurantiacum TaxID=273384 RepID=A0A1D7W3Z3_BREAU|nr:hypothetical protein BLSMQ_1992 [Brevibacterium aurantiacum]